MKADETTTPVDMEDLRHLQPKQETSPLMVVTTMETSIAPTVWIKATLAILRGKVLLLFGILGILHRTTTSSTRAAFHLRLHRGEQRHPLDLMLTLQLTEAHRLTTTATTMDHQDRLLTNHTDT
jgi:hypothetical protein